MPGMYGPMGRPKPKEPEPEAGDPNKYGGDTQIDNTEMYKTTHGGEPLMPAAGNGPAAQAYSVNYNSLAYFAKVMDDLDPYFQRAIDGLGPLAFNPGTRFKKGSDLQQEIYGIKNAGFENFAHFRQAVAELARKVESMAKAYANSDEMSEITADRVTADMGEVLGHVRLMPQLSLPGGASAGGNANTGDGTAATA